MGSYDYVRRRSREVNIGGIPLGGDNPVRIQSMTNTSTMDTEGSVAQCRRIAEAGADYVRLTAQGVREAENIGVVRRLLRDAGTDVPLVADIHFNPKAAFAAAVVTGKVRINPGCLCAVSRHMPPSWYGHTYRSQSRVIERPHHESLRRYSGRHGGERHGISARCRAS